MIRFAVVVVAVMVQGAKRLYRERWGCLFFHAKTAPATLACVISSQIRTDYLLARAAPRKCFVQEALLPLPHYVSAENTKQMQLLIRPANY